MRKLLIAFLLAASLGQAHAKSACFDEAANRYHEDVRLLRAIAQTENAGHDPRLVISGPGGRDYIGLMMVSSIWIPTLARFGISREDLMDPCINVNVAAWILRDAENRYGKTWKSVGAYNTGKYSADDAAQMRYVRKVWTHYVEGY